MARTTARALICAPNGTRFAPAAIAWIPGLRRLYSNNILITQVAVAADGRSVELWLEIDDDLLQTHITSVTTVEGEPGMTDSPIFTLAPPEHDTTLSERAQTGLGHAFENLSIISDTLAISCRFVPNKRLGTAVLIGSTICTNQAFNIMRSHDRQKCLTCASKMPADGPEQAEIHASELRLVHDLTDRRRAAHYALWAIPAASRLGLHRCGRIGRIADTAVRIGFDLTYGHLMRLHNRLQPWCPQCPPHQDEHAPVEPPTPLLRAAR